MARNRSHFRKGTFKCEVCGRNTRHTGDNDSGRCCPQCWELAGADNTHNDTATPPTEKEMAYYNALAEEAYQRGGDIDAIHDENPYIWERGK